MIHLKELDKIHQCASRNHQNSTWGEQTEERKQHSVRRPDSKSWAPDLASLRHPFQEDNDPLEGAPDLANPCNKLKMAKITVRNRENATKNQWEHVQTTKIKQGTANKRQKKQKSNKERPNYVIHDLACFISGPHRALDCSKTLKNSKQNLNLHEKHKIQRRTESVPKKLTNWISRRHRRGRF